MRRDGVVQYVLGDHLGSTSLSLDAAGAKLAESRYFPYGEERWHSGQRKAWKKQQMNCEQQRKSTPEMLFLAAPTQRCAFTPT